MKLESGGRIVRWLICVIFLFGANYSAYACQVVDDVGHNLRLEKPAQRIISLAPDITENLFAIGARKHIVGVISGSDYPKQASDILKVGSYSGIDLERIIALKPDLIVTWGNTFSRQLSALRDFGIPIYVSEPHGLNDVPRLMKNLGCLTGNVTVANQAADKFTQDAEKLRAQYQSQKPVTVFYQIGSYSLITINKESWITQIIELCGGRNIFANAKTVAPEVSWEAVVSANPQVIISDASDPHWRDRWQEWREMSAVKQGLLFTINPDLIERMGPRTLTGAREMCQSLQRARM